jgi:curved DNA-binding protein CbpA
LFLRRKFRGVIDAFDLLGQPRAPWLDQEKLKAAYRAKTLQSHPDVYTDDSSQVESAFANVNEAFQILQNPKRRLQHLLNLEGYSSETTGSSIPKELEQLFPTTISVIQNAACTLKKFQSATNSLSQALLKPELLEARTNAEKHLATISQLSGNEIEKLRGLNTEWFRDPPRVVGKLSEIYFQLTYLTRWQMQLEEKIFQLSAA